MHRNWNSMHGFITDLVLSASTYLSQTITVYNQLLQNIAK